ncbi:hypothetical protein [Mycobacterium sp. Marseille-P9652]|uniref:hypothetical protein n=1 Tax=Mycobacterium sp. Marseille-P9652 TaxID=2654950 RepID=UPI0018D1140B|nr:hypothetical protein [Mycobacterium sp. Marseille-P9652]
MFAATISLSLSLGLAAQAGADPTAFGGLTCACHETAPPGSAVLTDKINQGIHDGLGTPGTASAVVQ